jgi:hypothetical protein
MAGIDNFEKTLWAITVLLEALLAALLLYRKNYRTFPFFFAYLVTAITQSAILFCCYQIWGFRSRASEVASWSTQGVVLAARALAVLEICRRILARYRGIWALAWRLLLASAILVLLYSVVATGFEWNLFELNVDRGLELAVTVEILVLFMFAHYYEVEMEPAVRSLAIGFFLYSCFLVLNDTILERWKHNYGMLWNLLATLAYAASMLLWGWALRKELRQRASEPVLLSQEAYGVYTPEINFRLKHLNDHLSQFWDVEAKRP